MDLSWEGRLSCLSRRLKRRNTGVSKPNATIPATNRPSIRWIIDVVHVVEAGVALFYAARTHGRQTAF